MTSRSDSVPQSMPSSLSPAEKHRRAQWAARVAYLAVMLIFVSICAIAVTSTMQHEREKEGFHAIRVKKPISFFDYTYVSKSGEKATAHQK